MAFMQTYLTLSIADVHNGMNNILIFIPTIKKPLVSIEGAFAFEES